MHVAQNETEAIVLAELGRKLELIRKDSKIADLMKKAKTLANELNHRRDYLLKFHGIPLETFLEYIKTGVITNK